MNVLALRSFVCAVPTESAERNTRFGRAASSGMRVVIGHVQQNFKLRIAFS